MNNEEFNKAIVNFNDGKVKFNKGDNWSFLYNQKWYPTRAFMRHYYFLIGQRKDDLTLHFAVYELSKHIPVVSCQVEYKNHRPIEL
tara:strand:- start:155 stop:412 length:258 start_codon:yes stop_codon:yes gene_type:complete